MVVILFRGSAALSPSSLPDGRATPTPINHPANQGLKKIAQLGAPSEIMELFSFDWGNHVIFTAQYRFPDQAVPCLNVPLDNRFEVIQ